MSEKHRDHKYTPSPSSSSSATAPAPFPVGVVVDVRGGRPGGGPSDEGRGRPGGGEMAVEEGITDVDGRGGGGLEVAVEGGGGREEGVVMEAEGPREGRGA